MQEIFIFRTVHMKNSGQTYLASWRRFDSEKLSFGRFNNGEKNVTELRIGIDLLWVRVNPDGRPAAGGTVSYITNILDGFLQYPSIDGTEENFYLYICEDAEHIFEKYYNDHRFHKRICPVKSSKQWKRILWENLHLNGIGRRDKLDLWYIPVYSRPLMLSRQIPDVTVIHDLVSLHYPENFSRARAGFFNLSWKCDAAKSAHIVVISRYVREDFISRFKVDSEKVSVIYDPIIIKNSDMNFDVLADRYNIKKGHFLYTVSAIVKHKNLLTILKAVRVLKNDDPEVKLVISGVISDNTDGEIRNFIEQNDIKDNIIYTGRVPDSERDCLYDNCSIFLFPSVFEGFGMPAIEAMERGVPVITTKKTALYEVTQGQAVYVNDPYDEQEWARRIREMSAYTPEYHADFERYELEHIIGQYRKLFNKILKQR
jgi:glycosyltransferase involved in cell wall biosynthesis